MYLATDVGTVQAAAGLNINRRDQVLLYHDPIMMGLSLVKSCGDKGSHLHYEGCDGEKDETARFLSNESIWTLIASAR